METQPSHLSIMPVQTGIPASAEDPIKPDWLQQMHLGIGSRMPGHDACHYPDDSLGKVQR